MKILNDFFYSVRGNAIARSKDPIIGAFLIAWSVCNWDKLAILFWGTGEVEQRIKALSKKISIFTEPSLFWTDIDLVIFPFILTVLYLFIFPQLSLWVKEKQNKDILSGHAHAIDLDIQLIEKQKKLSKIKLRANPEKEFLAEEVKIDLQSEREKTERRHKILDYIDKKAKIAKAQADIKTDEAEKNRIELESKKRQEKTEKSRFEMQAAINKATIASARFPAIYQLMHILSQSLREDNITLSLDGLSNSIAALFGYNSSDEMIGDERFRTEEIIKIKYIYHDPEFLSNRIEKIIEEEISDNEELSAYFLFEHLQIILEKYSLEFLSDESLAEKIAEEICDNKYKILNSDELSGPGAETDTIFEDIQLEMDGFDFNTVFEVRMSGYASGYHRKDTDVRGRNLLVNITATAVPIVGRFGLIEYQLEIRGEPE